MPATHLDAAIERYPAVGTALVYARQVHAGQIRNSGDGEMPFIEHPVAVAERLAQNGYAEDVLATALLHDVLEKTDTDRDELEERFGESVAGLVDALSEHAEIETYGERKDEHRERVAQSGAAARAIFATDKLVNLEALREAYAIRGETVDEELQIPLDTKVRTWQLDLDMLLAAAPELPLVKELAEQLAALLADRAANQTPSSN
jgi:(p)ppGpp synthase/HD superfamily hydrolase